MSKNPNGPKRRTKTNTTTTTSFDAGTTLGRVLPHNDDAERAVLGSMLQDHDAIGQTISVLRDAGPEAFDAQRHQRLYEVLVQFYNENRSIDSTLLREELERRGWWEDLGGYEFLGRLVSSVGSSLRAPYYAEIVHDNYLLRQLIGAAHRVMDTAYRKEVPVKEALDYAEQEIFRVTERRVAGEAAALSELIRDEFKRIESRGEGVLTGEPTGFTLLDEYTCGLQPGELIVVAGRPSMGKTAFGLNVAEHMAVREQRPILFFSLEMSRQQLAQRVMCSQARIDSHRLRRGRQSSDDMRRLQAAADQLSQAPLLVDDTSHLTILELRARARMIFRKHKVRAIFVDYLQLMHVPSSESRQQEVASISRGLKALAKDLNIPVVAMAQLNRNPEDKARKGNRPRMSDLRESGAIEQDADVIMLLHREAYYQAGGGPTDPDEESAINENTAELIIAKQRNGPVGTITLHFNKQFTRFDNHDPRTDVADYAPAGASSEAPF